MRLFKNCEFADDYAHQRVVEVNRDVRYFLAGKKSADYITAAISVMVVTIVENLPNQSICLAKDVSCEKQAQNLLNNDNFIRKNLLLTPHKLGINLPEKSN